jgi:uncharacterized protein involved in exopolysaccharide biosynthesis
MNKENKSEREQIFAFLLMCLKNWHYFVISFSVCLVLALAYYKFATRIWEIDAKVGLTEEENLLTLGSTRSSMNSLMGMSTTKQNVEDEAIKIGSHGYIRKMVENLELNKLYFKSDFFGLCKTDLYDAPPVAVKTNPAIADTLSAGLDFSVNVGKKAIKIKVEYNDETLGKYEITSFPATIQTAFGDFTFTETQVAESEDFEKPYNLKIYYLPYDYAAQLYMESIGVEFENKKSALINLSMQHENKGFAKKILSEVIAAYNSINADEKNKISEKALAYIENRLLLAKSELELSERSVAAFKEKHKLTDVTSDLTYYYELNAGLEGQLTGKETQVKLFDLVNDFVSNDNNMFEQIPFYSVTMNETLAGLILQYNSALAKREDMLEHSNTKTSSFVDLEQNIERQRNMIVQTLDNLKKDTELSLGELRNKETAVSSKIGLLPSIERDFKILLREQSIQQVIYSFLVQKREDIRLKDISFMPKLRIIDQPYVLRKPVSPSLKKIVLMLLVFGGGIFPLGAIYGMPYIKQYFRKKKGK